MTFRYLPLVGLIAVPAFAQPAIDPTDPRPPEVEMRRRIEPLLPSIREGLRGDNVDAQRAALGIIADIPPAVAAQAKLGPALADFLMKDRTDTAMTAVALRVFGGSYPDPADVTRVIGKHAKSQDVGARRAAGASLANAVDNATPAGRSIQNSAYFVDTARVALPLIAHAIDDADGTAQRGGVLALEVIARVTSSLYRVEPDLAFEEPKALPADRFAPLNGLLRGLVDVIPKLPAALNSKDAETRAAAARALEAASQLREKVTLAKGPSEMERVDVLGNSWAGLQDALKKRIYDENPSVRLAVAEALESIHQRPEARAILRDGANDTSTPVRWTAARGLGRAVSGKPSADDIATLGKLAGDPDMDVRMTALMSLSRLGPPAAAAGPAVIASAGKGDTEPRVAAVRTISALQLPVDQALPVLIAGVNDPDVRLRREAAGAMVRFGPSAKAALPALRKAVASPDPGLRLTAAEAIFAIERAGKLKDL